LKSFGVEVIAPQHKYGKANLPSSHTVVVETIRELSKSPLRGKNILVTAGPTPGKIDYERIVTSRFRGRLDVKIADEAYMRGANVTLILGPGGIEGPPYLETIPTRDFYEYHSKVMGVIEQNPVDVGIFSAAVADYIPVEVFEGKIPSEGALESLRLKQTPKVVKEVRGKFPGLLMVTFKYEENISRKELKVIAQARMEEDYELVVANRGEDMNPQGDYGCIIVGKEGIIAEPSSRNECTMVLLDSLEKFYKS
jgi:phosphopantothenoylcysteine decarboxylase/phosphopantothenate--cysteine ligase